MPQILLCQQTFSPRSLQAQCGIPVDSLSDMGCQKPSMMVAHTPYLLGSGRAGLERGGYDHRILTRFASAPVATALTNLALPYGGDK